MAELPINLEKPVKFEAPMPPRLPPRRPTKLKRKPSSVTELPINPEKPVEYEAPTSRKLPPRSLIRPRRELPSVTKEPLQPKLSMDSGQELAVETEPQMTLKLSEIKLQCSLCHNTLQEPKLLPCLHTFCRIPCLERIVVKNNGRQSLTCPTCQCIVPLTDDGIAKLQTDFHAENMLKGQETLKKSKKTKRNCENCKKSSAVIYCQECKKFMCEKCQEMHQMWEDFSEHKLMASDSNLFLDTLTSAKCEKHKKREAIIFCETCSELICGDCAVIQHKGHLCNLIDDIFPRHKEELAIKVKPVQEMMDKIQKGLHSLNSRVKEINDQKATLEADIRRDIDQLQKILEQRKKELLTFLDRHTQQKLTDLAAQRVEIEKRREKVARCLDYATGYLQAEHKNEVLKMKAPILKQIEKLIIMSDLSVLQPRIEADIQYVTDNKTSQACKEFGDIESETNLMDNCYVDMDAINFELRSCQQVSYDNQKPSTHMEQNSSPVGVSRISIASQPDSCRSPLEHVRVVERLHGPFDVATNSKQEIIVAESNNHCVFLMISTGEKIFSFGKQGSGKGQFNRPSGVTVDKHDFIYVTDSSNHRIQKFTSEGGFVTKVGRHGNGRHQFAYPISICFNKTNYLLYVCDQGNHRIQVLTTDLKFVQSISSPGEGNGKLNYPKHCAFDSSNNLYVADSGNNCVQVFTCEGEFLRAFTNNYSLEKPFAIAVDSNDSVYVSERDQDQIKIFNVQGDYVSSFGVRGSKEGQFYDIRSIYFNGSNNTLVVSDFSNNRIQMFVV